MRRQRIVDAALELADTGGAEALSFRALAERLGSSTATLYRHFSDRAELVAEVVDSILGEVDLSVGTRADQDWAELLVALNHQLFSALIRHRRAAALLADRVPTGPRAMAIREAYLQILLRAGFSPSVAAIAAATLARYTLGFAIQLRAEGPSSGEDDIVGEHFGRADVEQYPAIRAVAEHMPTSLEVEFLFGVKAMIGGLAVVNEEGESPGSACSITDDASQMEWR